MANTADSRIKELEGRIAASLTAKGNAATALPGWIPDWLLEYAIAVLLAQLKASIKNEKAKATLRKVLKRVFDGIKAWYPGDPDFGG